MQRRPARQGATTTQPTSEPAYARRQPGTDGPVARRPAGTQLTNRDTPTSSSPTRPATWPWFGPATAATQDLRPRRPDRPGSRGLPDVPRGRRHRVDRIPRRPDLAVLRASTPTIVTLAEDLLPPRRSPVRQLHRPKPDRHERAPSAPNPVAIDRHCRAAKFSSTPSNRLHDQHDRPNTVSVRGRNLQHDPTLVRAPTWVGGYDQSIKPPPNELAGTRPPGNSHRVLRERPRLAGGQAPR